ncbi:MAG: DUF2776 family protein [Bilophila sp.]
MTALICLFIAAFLLEAAATDPAYMVPARVMVGLGAIRFYAVLHCFHSGKRERRAEASPRAASPNNTLSKRQGAGRKGRRCRAPSRCPFSPATGPWKKAALSRHFKESEAPG